MDINTMLTKRAKLVERIARLEARIERDTASLAKAKTDLGRLNESLAQSADLMAAMLDLDPGTVRNKLLQQADQTSPSQRSNDAPLPEAVMDFAPESAAKSDEIIEPENAGSDIITEAAGDNACGLKINPFESVI